MNVAKRILSCRPSGAWLSVLLAMVFVGWVATMNGYRGVFEIDPDESNNLIKALLLEHGGRFGGEMWSDQPPLFSYLLAGLFRVFGSGVDQARGFVLFLSGLNVWAVAEIARRRGGNLQALGSASLLLTSHSYVQLSVSVMIGLPSVTFASLSVLAWISALDSPPVERPRRRLGLLALSGALLGASLGTKLFTGFLVPPLFLALGLGEWWARGASGARFTRAAWRAAGLALVVALFAFAIVLGISLLPYLGGGAESDLLRAHAGLRATRQALFVGRGTVLAFLCDDAVLFSLAVLGVIWAGVRRRHALHLVGAWLLLATLALCMHFPVWPHHRVLMTVPAAVLAGVGLGETLLVPWRWVTRRCGSSPLLVPWLGWTILALLAVLPALLVTKLDARRLREWRHPDAWTNSRQDWRTQAIFEPYAAKAQWVVASRPMFAFRAGKPVPPALAVTSWKRFKSDELDTAEIVAQLRKYRPEVVLLSSRWPSGTRGAVRRQIGKTHQRVWNGSQQLTELWVSRAVVARMEATDPAVH